MRSLRRRIGMALTVGVALSAIAGAPVGGQAATSSCGSFRPVWSPNTSGAHFDHRLEAVAAFALNNMLAVGHRYGRPLVERWDGDSWAEVDPVVPTDSAGFTDIANIGSASAWAVGSRWVGGDRRSFFERLSGTTWSIVPSPSRVGATDLQSVDAVSSNDAWAVGTSGSAKHTLAMHWDGTEWSIQPTPDPSQGGSLFAVDMLSATSGWAVGWRGYGPTGGRALIERWDGTQWTAVPAPVIAGAQQVLLEGVAVRSPTSAIAVGYAFDAEFVSEPIAIRWNGSTWSRMPLALPSGDVSGKLHDVVIRGDGTAYAVGERLSAGHQHPLVFRWDGSTWIRMPVGGTEESKYVLGVDAASATDVMAVGTRFDDANGDEAKTFAMHCTP